MAKTGDFSMWISCYKFVDSDVNNYKQICR